MEAAKFTSNRLEDAAAMQIASSSDEIDRGCDVWLEIVARALEAR